MTLSVIIPVFNNFLVLEKTILSLKEQIFNDFELILINNGIGKIPDDLTAINNKKIIIINNPENQLFAKSLNIAFAKSKGKHILFMNSDVTLFKEAFIKLLNEKDKADCIWGKMLLPSGKTDSMGIYLAYAAIPRDRKKLSQPFMGPAGSCFLISREKCLEIIDHFHSLFNEEISFYYADIDFSLRLKSLNSRLKYIDNKIGTHFRSSSTPKNGLKNLSLLPAPVKLKRDYLKLLIKNRETFLLNYPLNKKLEKISALLYTNLLKLLTYIQV